MLLDTYAPIQKLAKAQSKLKSKPWLTRGIMTSIKKKNKIYKKFIKAKTSTEKNILYEFKNYRNLITKLRRISKARHYHHYFTDHKKRTCSKLGKELNYFFPEVFKYSLREMRYQLISNHHLEHLNTLGIISHCTDSFHAKPTTPGHPIPKISTHLFSEGAERQSLWKQSTDKRVHHQKRNQTDCTRNAQLSCEQFYCSSCCCMCCHTAACCMERT